VTLPGRRLALLIGSYAYLDAGLRPLVAPPEDVAALKQVLEDPDVGGFTVTTALDQPSYVVRRAVAELCADRRHDDLLLLYFSGHGIKDEAGRLFFATRDTETRLPAATSLAADFVNQALVDSRARTNILLLDCCYSGAFAHGLTKGDTAVHTAERFQGSGRIVLTASDCIAVFLRSRPGQRRECRTGRRVRVHAGHRGGAP